MNWDGGYFINLSCHGMFLSLEMGTRIAEKSLMLVCTGLSVYESLMYSLWYTGENSTTVLLPAFFPSSISGKHWLLTQQVKRHPTLVFQMCNGMPGQSTCSMCFIPFVSQSMDGISYTTLGLVSEIH